MMDCVEVCPLGRFQRKDSPADGINVGLKVKLLLEVHWVVLLMVKSVIGSSMT